MLELEDYQTIFSQHQDHEATQAKAEEVLKSYPKVCRRAWAYRNNKSGISSARVDGLPKNHTVINTVERRIVDGIYNSQKQDAIELSVDACGKMERQLLRLRYGIKEPSQSQKEREEGKAPDVKLLTDTETYMDLKISQSNYNHNVKPEALEQFAEVYMLDDLTVYKSETTK